MHNILLALVGLLSGWLAMWPAPGILAGMIAAGLLGVILASYLWLHSGARSVAHLAGVVATVIISHFLIVSMAPFALALLSAFGFYPETTGGTVAALAGAMEQRSSCSYFCRHCRRRAIRRLSSSPGAQPPRRWPALSRTSARSWLA